MSQAATDLADVRLHNVLHLVGITIFYYDYLRTFGDEYERIWRHTQRRTSYLFFLNRYLTFFGDIAVNVGNFWSFKTEESCRKYALYRTLLLIIVQVVVCFILFLRTWALYRRDKRIFVLVLSVSLCLLGLSCWSVVGEKSEVSLVGGCHTGLSYQSAIHVAIPWEALFVFDVMIFSLTLYRTYQARALTPAIQLSPKSDIVALIYRDGAIYFAVMASVNLANTVTFYTLRPLLRGVLSTAASSISVTMMAHLMLNLHDGAGAHGAHGAHSRSTENSTTLFFTTHVSSPRALAFGRDTDTGADAEGDADAPGDADPEPERFELGDFQVLSRA